MAASGPSDKTCSHQTRWSLAARACLRRYREHAQSQEVPVPVSHGHGGLHSRLTSFNLACSLFISLSLFQPANKHSAVIDSKALSLSTNQLVEAARWWSGVE